MKCLTIQQPWAWLIVNGVKDCENRSWYTTYRGPLLIHAAKQVDLDGYAWLKRQGVKLPALPKLDKGCIVGRAVLHKATRYKTSKWHAEGQCGFYLRDARVITPPIPFRGQQGIFNVSPEEFQRAMDKVMKPS